MKPSAKILRFKDRQFSTVDDIQEALFALVDDEKAGYLSSDEAREIQYQLTDMIVTAPGQSLNDQLLTVCGRLKLTSARLTKSARTAWILAPARRFVGRS